MDACKRDRLFGRCHTMDTTDCCRGVGHTAKPFVKRMRQQECFVLFCHLGFGFRANETKALVKRRVRGLRRQRCQCDVHENCCRLWIRRWRLLQRELREEIPGLRPRGLSCSRLSIYQGCELADYRRPVFSWLIISSWLTISRRLVISWLIISCWRTICSRLVVTAVVG